MMRMESESFWRYVWKILQEECGAGEDHLGFVCRAGNFSEWRFQGSLGFGGKIYYNDLMNELTVSCYPEDMTSERREMIASANKRLAEMIRSYNDNG